MEFRATFVYLRIYIAILVICCDNFAGRVHLLLTIVLTDPMIQIAAYIMILCHTRLFFSSSETHDFLDHREFKTAFLVGISSIPFLTELLDASKSLWLVHVF